MTWEKVKLGDICSIEKGNIGIMKAIPGDYPLVVLGEERRTHNEYQFDSESVVIPLVSSTGHGRRSMKRIFFQKGRFSVGNILCAVTPKDKNQLSAEFLYRYLDFNKENQLVSRMKGMANVTLPMKEIALVEIPLPPIYEQEKLIEEFQKLETVNKRLISEVSNQLELVRQLPQAFLREAMQGKLVPQDEADEPAENLQKKIKAEKAKLVAEKKIKKEKPLPEIKPKQIPFEIPKSWAWCRFSDVVLQSEAGNSFKCSDREILGNEWGVVKTSSVTSGFFRETENKFLSIARPADISKVVRINDLLFCRASGSKGLAGKCCIVHEVSKNLLLSDKTIRFQLSKFVDNTFVWLLNNSKLGESYYNSLNTGKSTSMNNVTRPQINSLIFPLPPLAEQKRIVEKLEKLMSFCDELEANIRQSKHHAETLLQVALKEALEPRAKN